MVNYIFLTVGRAIINPSKDFVNGSRETKVSILKNPGTRIKQITTIYNFYDFLVP